MMNGGSGHIVYACARGGVGDIVGGIHNNSRIEIFLLLLLRLLLLVDHWNGMAFNMCVTASIVHILQFDNWVEF